MLRFLFPVAAVSLAACAHDIRVPSDDAQRAQLGLVSAEKGAIVSEATLRRVTRDLSSDQFEGRAPATRGEDLTVQYLTRAFQRAGLSPGNGGSWTQDVPMVEITAQGGPQLRVTGDAHPLAFNYRTDMVVNSYRIQPEVQIDNSEIVFVGYGINAPERGWNDYAGVDVRGKTVIILVNDPDWQAPTTTGLFNGSAMTYYGRWTYKFEEAARQGAAAAFVVHDPAPASYGWAFVQNTWTGPQFFLDQAEGDEERTIANGWLSNEAARRLLAGAGQDLEALTRASQQRGFRAVPLNLRASLSIQNAIRHQVSQNVIGILPGRTRPSEYVLYLAHWDHLGNCAQTGEDRICNGALDNAAGTAALIALAEAHRAGPRLDRTIIFLAVTAEERGLLGSNYYAAHPVFPLARTAGGINIDAPQLAGLSRDVIVIGAGKSELDQYLQRAILPLGLGLSSERAPGAGDYYRSDHFSFAKQGVPMLWAESGDDLVNGGRAAGAAWERDYRANRYHRVTDAYDGNWEWSGMVRDLGIFHRVMSELGSTRAWPNWLPGDEFRGIRDRTAAQRQ
jgi:Zn-dependent M28 family amino/carboxypeptidase